MSKETEPQGVLLFRANRPLDQRQAFEGRTPIPVVFDPLQVEASRCPIAKRDERAFYVRPTLRAHSDVCTIRLKRG